MITEKDIEEDPHYQQFIINRNLKPASVRMMRQALINYTKYTGKTPSELIEEAEDEEEQRIRMKKRKIKKYINGFILHMKNNNNTPNTIITYLTRIKTFYRDFEIELPNIRCNIKDHEELITIKDIPDKEDIKTAIKYANLKYKAIIYLMMSSGMGSAEIRHLTLKDYIAAHKITDYNKLDIDEAIKLIKEKEKEIPTWSIRRIKTGMPYVTFSSPESNRAINDYIEDRHTKKGIKCFGEHLFENRGHFIKQRYFAIQFSRLNDRAGFGKYKNQNFFKSHNLRKFFASTLKNNGMDYLDAEWLIGHRIKTVTNAYIKPDIYRLKREYMQVLPYLSIEPVETVTIDSPEVLELKTRDKKRQKEIQEIRGLLKESQPYMEAVREIIDEDHELQEKVRKRIRKKKRE